MQIGEVAKRLGIRTSAIRYYESLGLLRRAPRTSGRRVYGEPDVARLRMVLAASNSGFTLAEIKRLVPVLETGHPGRARFQALAQQKLTELTAKVKSLETMRSRLRLALTCGCDGDPERCVLALA